ncbi:Uncharacterized protein TSPI_07029 [Trichinella spiralis]|uniref:Uncharacterized protein n=1 Tax=Trichinella spiralis TaxID=6334 RepID=A0ABR3KEC7_TRISP
MSCRRVFDSRTVLESFNLVDRNSICRLVSSSGKILFQVVDQDDTAWLVLPKVNYSRSRSMACLCCLSFAPSFDR